MRGGILYAGPLTAMQEKDIAECFSMLDEDGSGALDVSELVKAFKMLGFQVTLPPWFSCSFCMLGSSSM